MSRSQEHPIQTTGFWMFGILSVGLAVLKLTVAEHWSWWRVMLVLRKNSAGSQIPNNIISSPQYCRGYSPGPRCETA